MTTSLINKLKEIVGSIENAARNYERGGEISVLDEIENQALEDIQLAFKEAGYEIIPIGTIPTFKSYLKHVMTGQEWYNRFEKDLQTHSMELFTREEQQEANEFGKDVVAVRRCLAAARRAAGIEETS